MYTISSVSFYITTVLRRGNPKPYDRYNIPDMWSKHIHTYIYIYTYIYCILALLIYGPGGDRAPLPPPAAYGVSVGCYIIYRFRQTIGACAASRGCKNTKR